MSDTIKLITEIHVDYNQNVKEDFPQAKDIEPAIDSFKKVLDNGLIREALDDADKEVIK